MLKKTCSILAAAILVAGVLSFSGGGTAVAGERQQQVPANRMTSDRHDDDWEFYDCFDGKRRAEEVCNHLRRKGFDAKWWKEDGQYCVYTRKRR